MGDGADQFAVLDIGEPDTCVSRIGQNFAPIYFNMRKASGQPEAFACCVQIQFAFMLGF
jgi:hypothetical protein